MRDNILETGRENGGLCGISGGALKLVAILCMLADHIAAIFMEPGTPLYVIMRMAGRCTAPIMFYFLVEGYRHTKNVSRYTVRLAIFAAISYVPYVYCFSGALPNRGNFLSLNVLYTLLLGLLALRARNEIKNTALRWAAIGALLFLSLPADWSYTCILIVLVFDMFYGDFKKQAFLYCVIMLFRVMSYFSPGIVALLQGGGVDADYMFANLYRLGAFLPIVLLRFYNGRRGADGAVARWGFYIFYPAHLTVLALIFAYSAG